jgi:hypothetical protein
MATPKKSALADRANQLSAGVTKNFTAASTLAVGGQVLTQAQVLKGLAGTVALHSATTDAESAWRAAVAAQRQGLPALDEFVADLIASLKSAFGKNNPILASFAIAPPKARAARTTLQTAISTALAANTRAVRKTMSAKQRQAITATGKPGLTVVGPDGKPLLSVAPVAPGSREVQKVTVGAASAGTQEADSTAQSGPSALVPKMGA